MACISLLMTLLCFETYGIYIIVDDLVSLQQTAEVAENNETSEKETQLDSVTVEGWKKTREEWFEALKAGDVDRINQLITSQDIDVNTTDEVSH